MLQHEMVGFVAADSPERRLILYGTATAISVQRSPGSLASSRKSQFLERKPYGDPADQDDPSESTLKPKRPR